MTKSRHREASTENLREDSQRERGKRRQKQGPADMCRDCRADGLSPCHRTSKQDQKKEREKKRKRKPIKIIVCARCPSPARPPTPNQSELLSSSSRRPPSRRAVHHELAQSYWQHPFGSGGRVCQSSSGWNDVARVGQPTSRALTGRCLDFCSILMLVLIY